MSISYSGETLQEKPSPIQLKPALVRSPASRRGLNGTKPVPPIPRGTSPLPDKAELNTTEQKNEETESIWMSGNDEKPTVDLSELSVSDKELDQEEVGIQCVFHTLNRCWNLFYLTKI